MANRNTVVVELRLSSQNEHDRVGVTLAHFTDILQTTDDLNDVFVQLSLDLDMDILSISHSHHVYGEYDKDREPVYCFSSTCVFLSNGQSPESIATFVGRTERKYAFEDSGKVSILIEKFR